MAILPPNFFDGVAEETPPEHDTYEDYFLSGIDSEDDSEMEIARRQRAIEDSGQNASRLDTAIHGGVGGVVSGVASFGQAVAGGWQQLFESTAATAYGLDTAVRSDPLDWDNRNIVFQIGEGLHLMADAIPHNPEYQTEILAGILPSAFGSVAGAMIGSKGVPVPKGMVSRLGQRARKVKGLTKDGGLGALRAPARIRSFGDKGAQLSGAWVGMTGMEGFYDARRTLMENARDEGRTELTEAEIQKSWDSLAHNLPAGLSEMASIGSGLKALKWLDKTTKGGFGNMATANRYSQIAKGAFKGARREIIQENAQNAWLNWGASTMARYDEGRELWRGWREATIGGGAVGAIFGGFHSARTRRASLHTRMQELRDMAWGFRSKGDKNTADQLEKKAEEIEAVLVEDIHGPPRDIDFDEAFPSSTRPKTASEISTERRNSVTWDLSDPDNPTMVVDVDGEMVTEEDVTIAEEALRLAAPTTESNLLTYDLSDPMSPVIKDEVGDVVEIEDGAVPDLTPVKRIDETERDGTFIQEDGLHLADADTQQVVDRVIPFLKKALDSVGIGSGYVSLRLVKGLGGVSVDGNDHTVVRVDTDWLRKRGNQMGKRRFNEYLKRAMDEEVRHIALEDSIQADFIASKEGGEGGKTWREFREERLAKVWSEMSEEERAVIREARTARGSVESETQLAAEFLRYAWQSISTGKVTEEYLDNKSTIREIIENFIKYLRTAIKRGGKFSKTVMAEIDAAENHIKNIKAKAEKAKKPKGEKKAKKPKAEPATSEEVEPATSEEVDEDNARAAEAEAFEKAQEAKGDRDWDAEMERHNAAAEEYNTGTITLQEFYDRTVEKWGEPRYYSEVAEFKKGQEWLKNRDKAEYAEDQLGRFDIGDTVAVDDRLGGKKFVIWGWSFRSDEDPEWSGPSAILKEVDFWVLEGSEADLIGEVRAGGAHFQDTFAEGIDEVTVPVTRGGYRLSDLNQDPEAWKAEKEAGRKREEKRLRELDLDSGEWGERNLGTPALGLLKMIEDKIETEADWQIVSKGSEEEMVQWLVEKYARHGSISLQSRGPKKADGTWGTGFTFTIKGMHSEPTRLSIKASNIQFIFEGGKDAYQAAVGVGRVPNPPKGPQKHGQKNVTQRGVGKVKWWQTSELVREGLTYEDSWSSFELTTTNKYALDLLAAVREGKVRERGFKTGEGKGENFWPMRKLERPHKLEAELEAKKKSSDPNQAAQRSADSIELATESAEATDSQAKENRQSLIDGAAKGSEDGMAANVAPKPIDRVALVNEAVEKYVDGHAQKAVNSGEISASEKADTVSLIRSQIFEKAAAGDFDSNRDGSPTTAEDISRMVNNVAKWGPKRFIEGKVGQGKVSKVPTSLDAPITEGASESFGEGFEAGGLDPASALAQEGTVSNVQKAIASLPADQARVMQDFQDNLPSDPSKTFNQTDAQKRLGMTRQTYRTTLNKAKAGFESKMKELSQTDDKSLWAFDPLDDSEIKAYDAASEIQRDSATGARTGILPKEEYPGMVGAGMEGKRIPTLGADFSDTARRHASAIFQTIEIFGQSLQNFYGVDKRLASQLTFELLNNRTKSLKARKAKGTGNIIDPAPELIDQLAKLREHIPDIPAHSSVYSFAFPGLANGAEANVYLDKEASVVYKVFTLESDGAIGRAAPLGKFLKEDRPEFMPSYKQYQELGDMHTLSDIANRFRIQNNHGGFVFTEIAGVITDHGLVVKQRFIHGRPGRGDAEGTNAENAGLTMMTPTAVDAKYLMPAETAIHVHGTRAFVHGDLTGSGNIFIGKKDNVPYMIDVMSKELSDEEMSLTDIGNDMLMAAASLPDMTEGMRQFAFDPLGDIQDGFTPATKEEEKAFERARNKKRNPWLTVAAVRMANDEISVEEYRDAVDALGEGWKVKSGKAKAKGKGKKAWEAVKEYLGVPDRAQIQKYLPAKKDAYARIMWEGRSEKRLAYALENWGEVEVRIDIPTFNSSLGNGDPVYSVTIHEKGKASMGDVLSWTDVARVKDFETVIRLIGAASDADARPIDIAKGSNKLPFATVRGEYAGNDLSVTEKRDIFNPKKWREVGFNPVRSSQFTDVRTGEVVTGGSEAIMLGSRVFVKNDSSLKKQPAPKGNYSSTEQFAFDPIADQDYMAAAEAGDISTAQKMVNKAAKAAGYVVGPVYHGSPSGGFASFDTYGSRYGLFGMGAYFTDSREIAETYASKSYRRMNKAAPSKNKVYNAFLGVRNPINMDATADRAAWAAAAKHDSYFYEEEILNLPSGATNEDVYRLLEDQLEEEGTIPDWEGAESMQQVLLSMGFDGATHKGGRMGGDSHQVTIAFDPEQIKSADPITKDEAGNIIPLSKRFDSSKDDMMFAFDPLEESLETSSSEHASDLQMSLVKGGNVLNHGEFGTWGDRFKRFFTGGWLSATDTLESIGFKGLADRIYTYQIRIGEVQGKLMAPLKSWRKGKTVKEISEAYQQVGEYFALRENYGSERSIHLLIKAIKAEKKRQSRLEPDARDWTRSNDLEAQLSNSLRSLHAEANNRAQARRNSDAFSPAAEALVKVIERSGTITGQIATKLGIKVQDGATWRLMRDLGPKHYPRSFAPKVMEVIQSKNLDPNLYAKLIHALRRDGVVDSDHEAELYLNELITYSEMSGGEFMANMEKARGLRLPAEFYDTSVDNYIQFLNRFADRAAQVHSFGQSTDTDTDAFGAAIKTTPDREAREYLQAVANDVYRRKTVKTGADKLFERMVSATGIAYLSGGFTAVRDFVSGVMLSNEQFGFKNTAAPTFRALIDAAKALAGSVKNWSQKDWQNVTPEITSDAEAIGAIRENFIQAQLLDQRLDPSDSTDQRLIGIGDKALYFKQAMDRLARGVTMGASLNWLESSKRLYSTDKDSKAMRKRIAALKRLKFSESEAESLVSGDEQLVEEFARRSVAEKQYTYSLAQHPLFIGASSPVMKLMFQFQRWTFQRGRDLIKNVIIPAAWGTEVKGSRVKDVMPLLRFAGAGVLFGELLKWLMALFTDKEDRTASIEEILRSDDGAAKALDRIARDFIFTGATGFIGDYGMMIHEQASRGPRWKDPFKPPLFNLVQDTIGAGRNFVQKGATWDAFKQESVNFVRGLPATAQIEGFTRGTNRWGRKTLGIGFNDPVWEARRDLSFTRMLARRYGEDAGLDIESRFYGTFAADKYAAQKTALKQALMTGDTAGAIEARDALLDLGMTKAGIKASVRSGQPWRVGMKTNADVQRDFERWVRKNRPSDLDRVKRVQSRYTRTSSRLGL